MFVCGKCEERGVIATVYMNKSMARCYRCMNDLELDEIIYLQDDYVDVRQYPFGKVVVQHVE